MLGQLQSTEIILNWPMAPVEASQPKRSGQEDDGQSRNEGVEVNEWYAKIKQREDEDGDRDGNGEA
jgi:hypothetical protein